MNKIWARTVPGGMEPEYIAVIIQLINNINNINQ
jgi:hypothetical protein